MNLGLPSNIAEKEDNDGSALNDEISQISQKKNAIMNRQDFFIWQSTVEQHVSLRDKIDGSPFTKALVASFKECAYKYDLYEIYIQVNSYMEKYGASSLSTLYNVATKHFYFKISEKQLEKL